MHRLILILLLVLILTSCGQTTPVSLSSKSPDGKTTISVNAKKQTSLDPFVVVLGVKSGDVPNGSLKFEVAASSLDSTNVKFDWQDPNNCRITFTQTDGEKKMFTFYATATNVVLQEYKEK